jgi:hypothetical protein
MDVLWTYTAEEQFHALHPNPIEFHQVIATLHSATRGGFPGVPIRSRRFFVFRTDYFLVDCERFVITYRRKGNRLSVLSVRLAKDSE